jgi:ABC-2 type transport system ATP-binding protein
MMLQATGLTVEEGAAAAPRLASAGRPVRLAATGVTKRWEQRVILDRVDLTVERGTLLGLVGANGVGKTTFLRILAGVIWAAEGTVALDGVDIRADERAYKRRLGFVPAGQTGLYPRLTPQQQLEYWARIAFVPRRARRDAVERSIALFGLDDVRGRRLDRMSMGQRQRVRLAMGFLHEPTLVLLDEPQTSLDPAGLEMLASVITEFVSSGGAVVWCAPTAGELPLPADRAYVLEAGRLTQA